MTKRELAKDPNTPPETLRFLATDENYCVRFYVAINPNTPLEALRILATDNDVWVRENVGKHPNSTELIKRLVLMTNTQVGPHE